MTACSRSRVGTLSRRVGSHCLLGVVALLALACRPREGERCICGGDCAGGLVCASDGAILRGGQCVSGDLESGTCVDADNVESDENSVSPPPKFDAGSWATSGSVPVTAASQSSEGDASTTMPESSTSASSSTAGDTGEATGSSTSTGNDATSSSDTGQSTTSSGTDSM